jgi:hypothetical protein
MMSPGSSKPRILACCAWMASAACSPSSIPDPKDALHAYQEAAQRGDSRAIYDMLSERARQSWRPADVERIVGDEKVELAALAKAVSEPGAVIRATARVRYPDGEDASLDLEDNAFHIRSADALPAAARTPREALEQLRRALARRNYAALMRVLSPTTRSAIESDLRSLVDGLKEPDGLDVQISGDAASVQIQGGHSVKLRRDGGLWKVEDFD